jgi:hypothetical protein
MCVCVCVCVCVYKSKYISLHWSVGVYVTLFIENPLYIPYTYFWAWKVVPSL